MSNIDKGDKVRAIHRSGEVLEGFAYGSGEGLRLELHVFSPRIDWLETNGFTITVIEKLKPKVELPTEFGSGIYWNQGDMKGTRVAMRTGSWHGKMWHYLAPGADSTSEYSDEGIRKLVGDYRFTTVRAVAS